MILELPITDGIMGRAKSRLKSIPKLKNSITGNTATLHGLVGEELVAEYLGATVIGDFNYDLIKGDIRLEVKTKRTDVVPLNYYDVSIADYNTTQECHYYAFTRIMNDFSSGWFLGVMPKKLYLIKSRKLKKGELDGNNGFRVKADCWNLRIDELLDCDLDEFDLD